MDHVDVVTVMLAGLGATPALRKGGWAVLADLRGIAALFSAFPNAIGYFEAEEPPSLIFAGNPSRQTSSHGKTGDEG